MKSIIELSAQLCQELTEREIKQAGYTIHQTTCGCETSCDCDTDYTMTTRLGCKIHCTPGQNEQQQPVIECVDKFGQYTIERKNGSPSDLDVYNTFVRRAGGFKLFKYTLGI